MFSGHKMLGPYGIGGLYGRSDVLEALPPFLTGGSMITKVTLDRTEYLPPPQRFEAGTQPVSQAIALAAAVRYLDARRDGCRPRARARLGAPAARRPPRDRRRAPARRRTEGIERVGLAAFDVDGVHAHDVGQYLDSRGIAVRVGHHCAAPLHARFGLTASVRASTALYNTTDEVDVFLDALADVRPFFGAGA